MLCLPNELSLSLFGNNINYYLLFNISTGKKCFPIKSSTAQSNRTQIVAAKSQSFAISVFYSERVFDLFQKHVSINIQIDVVCFCVTQPKWNQTKKWKKKLNRRPFPILSSIKRMRIKVLRMIFFHVFTEMSWIFSLAIWIVENPKLESEYWFNISVFITSVSITSIKCNEQER